MFNFDPSGPLGLIIVPFVNHVINICIYIRTSIYIYIYIYIYIHYYICTFIYLYMTQNTYAWRVYVKGTKAY